MDAKDTAENIMAELEEDGIGELIETPILDEEDSPYRVGNTCLIRMRLHPEAIMSGEIVRILSGHEREFLVRPLIPGWESQRLVGNVREIALLGLYPQSQ